MDTHLEVQMKPQIEAQMEAQMGAQMEVQMKAQMETRLAPRWTPNWKPAEDYMGIIWKTRCIQITGEIDGLLQMQIHAPVECFSPP